MLILGLSGGFDFQEENLFDLRYNQFHDSAAVLVKDGKVLAGLEEERSGRIKHTNKFAANAAHFCLSHAGISVDELDKIAFYCTEQNANNFIQKFTGDDVNARYPDGRSALIEILQRTFDQQIDSHKIEFVPHHIAHAASTFHMSGLDESLILVIDAEGDGASGMALSATQQGMVPLQTYSMENSLGLFYLKSIRFLGYSLFDEYKVMGLAPYGDPSIYRGLFSEFYELGERGRLKLFLPRIESLGELLTPRKKGEPFNDMHKNIAAALQEALERVGMHIVRGLRSEFGYKNLCMAGGVAHNCTLNGKILAAELFDNLFIQPASHDAGCALGSALYLSKKFQPEIPIQKVTNVYWGAEAGGESTVLRILNRWSKVVRFKRLQDTEKEAAELLSKGEVLGWVQGRSEFGPRALGNRSILADPRPAENKARINQMIKKREGYRPFAPSVLEEHASELFDVSDYDANLSFMTYVVPVRPAYQEILGATTHIDGSSRIQTVNKRDNARYWTLISEFHRLTGVPVLLNTSFNNHAEPIVDSIEDALISYLTTELDKLVIGDFLIWRAQPVQQSIRELKVGLPLHVGLATTGTAALQSNFHPYKSVQISPEMQTLLLSNQSHDRNTGEYLSDWGWEQDCQDKLVQEIETLWSDRIITLEPKFSK
ncbi:MAG: nodulation protein [Gammaproteobacteria bacterium]|nr:nodulation protein [Gammaproteobacteria bacterium]